MKELGIKAYSICCLCHREIYTTVREPYQKLLLEHGNDQAVCRKCEPKSRWIVI